ncbi:MAG: hypothetical protein LQ342_004244 [Letrouitia transgressa]|nr:MAG: hypothetical protein LQ342_004244 [Letrouitia transgressa]
MATYLYFDIQRLQELIRDKVIPDIEANPSQHGYTAFFKTEAHKPIVKDLLTRVVNGDTFLDRCLVAPTAITMDCVSPFVWDNPDEYTKFYQSGPNNFVAFFIFDHPNIMRLCPRFFALPEKAQLEDCPSVRRNKMTNAPNLAFHRLGVLTHELAHKYGASGDDEDLAFPCKDITEPDDDMLVANGTFAIQDCAQLSADKQLKNAQNYAFYVGCEFRPLFMRVK